MGAGASRERSVFAAAADALRGVAPAARQQLALPGLRPAPPLEAASASDPAARVHNLLAPLLDALQARLRTEHPTLHCKRYVKPTFSRPMPAALARAVGAECTAVVAALAD